LTREEEADKALRHTVFAPGVIPALILSLLLCIFLVPLLQVSVDLRQDKPPQIQGFSRLLPSRSRLEQAQGRKRKLLALLPPEEDIRALEESLEQNSVVSETLLPPTQMFLTGMLGAGNKQVYAGQRNTLHYGDDVDYLMRANPLLSPDAEKVIAAQIIGMDRQLSAVKIKLIVMPVPPKTVLYPEMLSRRYTGDAPLENVSMLRLKARFRQAGVAVLDIVPLLSEAKLHVSVPLWMPTDSHWSPEGMDITAQALARFVRQNVSLPPAEPADLALGTKEIAYRGDLTRLLHLPDAPNRFTRIPIRVQPVVDARSGRPWSLRQDADVALVGDSLSEIFDDKDASLAHHLSYYLRRPVDRINDPKHRLPPMLYIAELLAAHPERLRGKRVCILEFHGRMIEGDLGAVWRPLDLNLSAVRKP
jgi:hypothetical protein